MSEKKAIDNGRSNHSEFDRQEKVREKLIRMGWVNWVTKRLTRAGGMVDEYWFEPSRQGVRDLIEILDFNNPERRQNVSNPEIICWLDGINSVLYVQEGTEQHWIGKEGLQIKKLSNAWGRYIQVQPIKIEEVVSWEIGTIYVDDGWKTGIILTAMERYTCGDKISEFKIDLSRGGTDIIRNWFKAQGIELRPHFQDEFPISFCEEMSNIPKELWQDKPFRRAIREKKIFNGKTIEEWYQTFFAGKSFNSYIEAL